VRLRQKVKNSVPICYVIST